MAQEISVSFVEQHNHLVNAWNDGSYFVSYTAEDKEIFLVLEAFDKKNETFKAILPGDLVQRENARNPIYEAKKVTINRNGVQINAAPDQMLKMVSEQTLVNEGIEPTEYQHRVDLAIKKIWGEGAVVSGTLSESESAIAVVMKKFSGENLANWLNSHNQNDIDLMRRLKICLCTILEVIAINRKGWVHRDIKPDNFLIDNEDHVSIIDLDFAQSADLAAMDQNIMGSHGYIAPEISKQQGYDEATEIYALAQVLKVTLGWNFPSSFSSLFYQAQDENPNNRPTLAQLFDKFSSLCADEYGVNLDSQWIKKIPDVSNSQSSCQPKVKDPAELADEEGNTFLHLAAKDENKIFTKWLLRMGVNPFAKNKQNQTAFELASKEIQRYIVNFFEKEYGIKFIRYISGDYILNEQCKNLLINVANELSANRIIGLVNQASETSAPTEAIKIQGTTVSGLFKPRRGYYFPESLRCEEEKDDDSGNSSGDEGDPDDLGFGPISL